MDIKDIEVHFAEDWAAVYENGELAYEHHVDDMFDFLFSKLKIKEVHDDAFLRGGSGQNTAKTLVEVYEYRQQRELKLDQAKLLLEQASELREEAERLEEEAHAMHS